VLGRHRHEFRIGKGAGAGEVEHPGAEVDPDHAALGADSRRQQVCDQACPTTHIQNSVASAWRHHIDKLGRYPAVKPARPCVVFGSNPVVELDEMLDQLVSAGQLHWPTLA